MFAYRHSGCLVAIPEVGKGLTGEKVACAMVRHQCRPFGVPSVVTSEKGSQFIECGCKICAHFQGYGTPCPTPTTTEQTGVQKGGPADV